VNLTNKKREKRNLKKEKVMKYTLYKELLDQSNILSHVFFNCASEFIQDIANGNEGLTEEQIKARKIDIELKIDGHVCNPENFFKTLYSQYAENVQRVAAKLVEERTSEKFAEIANKLEEYREITEQWAKDINWEIPNPLAAK
jgi:hypothetical protein